VKRATLRRAIWAALLAGCGLAGAVAVATPASAQPVTHTFDFRDTAQELVVPAEVCQVTVDAFGAEGGGVEPADEGGLGGRATAVEHE
jgi:ABC-type glycerol-3-phosphate transport system substrate-binding protein